MNPYEVVFLKASWHVGEPFADKYAMWETRILRGYPGTSGAFDEPMYHFAVQCAPPSPALSGVLFPLARVGPCFAPCYGV